MKEAIELKDVNIIEKENFELINSIMSKDEAIELIQNLYKKKIHFHQMKNFRSVEKYGEECKTSIKRIKFLQKNLIAFLELMKNTNDSENVTINTNITISISK